LFAGAALAAYPYAYGYADPYAYDGYGYPYAYGNAYPYAYGSGAYPYAYPYQAPAYAPAATGGAPAAMSYAPAATAGAPAAMSYALAGTGASLWYYCQNPAGYYPYVQQCPTQWQPVPGRPAG
jgi:hypothetical protein